jgi:hypothetical protein
MAFFVQNYLDDTIKKLNSTKETVELEVRFQDVDFKEYFRSQQFLTEKFGEVETISIDDTKKGEVRQSVVQNPDGSSYYVNIIKKELYPMTYDNRFIDVKISVSIETETKTTEPFVDYEIQRLKQRQSFVDSRLQIRYDITKVTQTEKGKAPRDRFEIEIESLHPLLSKRSYPMSPEELKEFTQVFGILGNEAAILRSKMQDSDMAYASSTKKELASFITIALNTEKYRSFKERKEIPYRDNYGYLARFSVEARNIKRRDMKYGGILNKPPGTTYSVTVKADGSRKFLLIHKKGLWLIFPGTYKNPEMCKICSFESLPLSWKNFENTILDGESIPMSSRKYYKDIKHYYLPFDTLLFKGKDVTKEPLSKRLEYLYQIRNLGALQVQRPNKTEVLMVMEEKPFYFFDSTAESFFEAFSKIEKFSKTVKYELDGYIFTPNSEYNPQERNKPDILKWKPFEELTIDMSYNYDSKRRWVSVWDKSVNGNIEFIGSDINIFDSELQVEWTHPSLKDVPSGTIIEFSPKKVMDSIIMTPKRIRFDKQRPNALRTASDIWEDINRPINIETLRGLSMDLVRQYHNDVKRKILSQVSKEAHCIDIGFGNGGDLSKMDNFSKVLAIEPNSTNLKELYRRLDSFSGKEKFHLLQAGGEETDRILSEVEKVFGDDLGTQPMYISMMLSLSFFWGQKEMLECLLNTILGIRDMCRSRNKNQEVKFVFLTIESERTLKLLKKYNNFIDFPFLTIKFNGSTEEVYLNIPGTIVGEQTEYLVKLNELPLLMDAVIDYEKNANEQTFLNKYEKEFTSMYVYGQYSL